MHRVRVAVDQKLDAGTRVHFCGPGIGRGRNLRVSSAAAKKDATHRGRLQIEPPLPNLPVTAHAAGVLHLSRERLLHARPFGERVSVLGVIPCAVVKPVAVDPSQEQIALLAAQAGDASAVTVEQQRFASGARRSRARAAERSDTTNAPCRSCSRCPRSSKRPVASRDGWRGSRKRC